MEGNFNLKLRVRRKLVMNKINKKASNDYPTQSSGTEITL
jgi:hypothetical protein